MVDEGAREFHHMLVRRVTVRLGGSEQQAERASDLCSERFGSRVMSKELADEVLAVIDEVLEDV